jgi:general secretion pathway protein L
VPRAIFLPDTDDFATLSATTEVRCLRLGSPVGASSATESLTSSTSAFQGADDIIAIVPVSRIAFIDTLLPPVARQKRDQLVNFAIEDKLTIDPATIHAVILGPAVTGANRHVVVAIDLQWLRDALDWLKSAGVNPTKAIAATALNAVADGEWLMSITDAKAHACSVTRADGLAYHIDYDDLTTPPFTLTLALNEIAASAASGATPRTLRLVAPDSIAASLDRDAWQRALGSTTTLQLIPASAQIAMQHSAALSLNRANLLTGEFQTSSPASSFATAAKAAWVLAFAIVACHVLFVAIDSWRLSRERVTAENEMRQLFLQAFPNATAIVDPALQMSRNLQQLKADRGMGSTDHARRGLAIAADVLGERTSNLGSIAFDNNELVLTMSALTPTDLASLARDSRIVIRSADEKNNGKITLVIMREAMQ